MATAKGMGGEIWPLSLLQCCDSAMGLDQVQTADATVTEPVRLYKLYKVPFDSGVFAVEQLGCSRSVHPMSL